MQFFRLDRPITDRLFGQAHACACFVDEAAERRAARLRSKSGIPTCFKDMSFRSFNEGGVLGNLDKDRRAMLDFIKRECYAFAQEPSDRCLVLLGRCGTGKTHLAAATASGQLYLDRAAYFAIVPDMLDMLRSGYSDGNADVMLDDVKNVAMLVLDDMGAQRDTGWAAEKLYQLVNHRYNEGLPMMLTSNVPMSDWDIRIASRLTEGAANPGGRCQILHLDVPDQRPVVGGGA